MPVSYPVALKLDGRPCLVIGSGAEARERAHALLRSGARVRLLTPEAAAEHAELRAAGVELVTRAFEDADADGCFLVVLTDRDETIAERLRLLTEARGQLFCAVDQPRFSNFSYLAIARAGLAFAAIGTEGEAPALARRLRELLEQLFERSALAAFAERLAALRRRTPSERRRDVLGAAVAGIELDGKLVLPALETKPD